MGNQARKHVQAIRELMEARNLDALYFPGTDPHMSEYLCDHWQIRRFITGFTGSYGEVVITRDDALLWTDTRYFLQASDELEGSGIRLMKLRIPGAEPVHQWLPRNLAPGARVGMDPRTMPLQSYRLFAESLKSQKIALVAAPGILEKVWTHRPPVPAHTVIELDPGVTGLSRAEKFSQILEKLKTEGADFTVITALDDLAWCYNLRGSDVPYNPVWMGFAIIGEGLNQLFVLPGALPSPLRAKLEHEGITINDYPHFYNALKEISKKTVFLDPASVNSAIYREVAGNCRVVEGTSIPAMLKSVKNETELAGFRDAMLKDGVAMVQFLEWLRREAWQEELTEFTIATLLKHFRACQPGFMGESFAPIIGYREHGAIIHFSVNASNALPLHPDGVLLVDSGGQYLTGTTDITRTIALGPVTPRQKSDFTLVLKGLIALSAVKFPYGTRGIHLDILARQALWQHGLNYGHGTGHGIGHFLNVHEGPASIRQEWNPHPIEAGMVFSNEPGIYRTGEYGIRIENVMVCIEKEVTEFGRFLGFETLTLCPIDRSLIISGMLTPEEKNWLNAYHLKVREELRPLIPADLIPFLNDLTGEM